MKKKPSRTNDRKARRVEVSRLGSIRGGVVVDLDADPNGDPVGDLVDSDPLAAVPRQHNETLVRDGARSQPQRPARQEHR